jgi:hypothetical protein
MLSYTKVEKATPDGTVHEALKIVEGTYKGLIWTYGRVQFLEDKENDLVKLNFEYEIIKSPIPEEQIDKNLLKNELGDILKDMIVKQLEANELIYTGGTDENRTGDSEESDRQ